MEERQQLQFCAADTAKEERCIYTLSYSPQVNVFNGVVIN